MHDYDREYIRRTTPIYGGLRAARYGDFGDQGYVPLSPTHPLARRLRAGGSPLGPGPGRGRRGYDVGFQPLRPNDALARALREDAEDLVTDFLREERYGDEYARSMGLRTRGPGDRFRNIARRMSGARYDRGW